MYFPYFPMKGRPPYIPTQYATNEPNTPKIHLTTTHQISGEWHDDLGRQRYTRRLDGHQKNDAEVTHLGNCGDDEPGEYGDNFCNHKRAIYRSDQPCWPINGTKAHPP